MDAINNIHVALTYRLGKTLDESTVSFILDQLDLVLSDYKIQQKNLLPANISGNDIIEKYLIALKAAGVKNSSIKTYLCRLRQFNLFITSMEKQLLEVRAEDVRMFFVWMQQHNAARSVDHCRNVLNGLYKWLYAENYIDKNPMIGVQRVKFQQKPRKIINEKNLEAMRYTCRNNIKYTAIFELMYNTGIRNSELCNLKWKDIDWNDHSVTIIGKGDKIASVWFNARTEEALLRWKEFDNGDYNNYVFHRRGDKNLPLTGDGLRYIFMKMSKDAGVPKVIPHRMRHTTATRLLRTGVPLEEIQMILRHSRIETTQLYAKVNKDKVKLDCLNYI